MRNSGNIQGKRGPVAIAELVGRVLDPVTARRGFATAELIAGWAEIVGERYADCSRPQRIVWPRGKANADQPGTLIVAIEGPRALLLQHEADQIIERVNAFLGHGAIGKIRIVQDRVSTRTPPPASAEAALGASDLTKLEEALFEVDSPDLRSALERLGRAVLVEHNKKT